MQLTGMPSDRAMRDVDVLDMLLVVAGEAGVVVVTAAGNNFGNLPTRNIVYPARFNRVVAACGVMADQAPYADLGVSLMAGNYGPPGKMRTAIAAYTPNVPWARFG